MLQARWVGWFALALSVAITHGAAAQTADDATRSAARELGKAGEQAFRDNSFLVAEERSSKAFALYQLPSLGLWSARALDKNGKLAQAAARYREVLLLPATATDGDAATQDKAKVDARAELDALTPRIPSVVVTVEGAAGDVAISIGGVAVPQLKPGEPWPVDLGAQLIEGRQGSVTKSVSLTFTEGAKLPAVLHFDAPEALPTPAQTSTPAFTPLPSPGALPAPEALPPPRPPTARATDTSRHTPHLAAWLLLGGGGLALATGAVTGVMTLQKKSDIDASPYCRDNQCLSNMSSTVDDYATFRTVSSVSLGVGAGLALLGVVVYVATPTPASDAGSLRPRAVAIQPWLGTGSTGVSLQGTL
jgi:hypothetical protein